VIVTARSTTSSGEEGGTPLSLMGGDAARRWPRRSRSATDQGAERMGGELLSESPVYTLVCDEP
jgi:hypothetical protein